MGSYRFASCLCVLLAFGPLVRGETVEIDAAQWAEMIAELELIRDYTYNTRLLDERLIRAIYGTAVPAQGQGMTINHVQHGDMTNALESIRDQIYAHDNAEHSRWLDTREHWQAQLFQMTNTVQALHIVTNILDSNLPVISEVLSTNQPVMSEALRHLELMEKGDGIHVRGNFDIDSMPDVNIDWGAIPDFPSVQYDGWVEPGLPLNQDDMLDLSTDINAELSLMPDLMIIPDLPEFQIVPAEPLEPDWSGGVLGYQTAISIPIEFDFFGQAVDMTLVIDLANLFGAEFLGSIENDIGAVMSLCACFTALFVCMHMTRETL